MVGATSLMGSTRPVFRMLGNPRHQVGIDTGLLAGLYRNEIHGLTEPTYVVARIRDFYAAPFRGDTVVQNWALKTNATLDRLTFAQYRGSPSIATRLASLADGVKDIIRQTYTSRALEALHAESGEIYDRAAAQNLDFYPFNVRDQIVTAATLLRDIDRYDTLARTSTHAGAPAFISTCGRYYTTLFRVAAQILIPPAITSDGNK